MKVTIKNLARHFPRVKAVDDISFSFSSGEIFGFIGPNGAGKTTTIRIMASLDLPTSGDVYYDGVSVVDYPEKVRKIMGYMPDSLPGHADIMVWEYLDFFARAAGLKGQKRTKVLHEIEDFTKLGELREKYLKELSKGMKQRVSLARALVHDPQVLIMDEPAAGLDPRARIELRELLRALADQGKAVLISSHILSELEDICHGAVIIETGKLLKSGLIEDLIVESANTGDSREVVIRFTAGTMPEPKFFLEQPFVVNVNVIGENAVEVEMEGTEEESSTLMTQLIHKGCGIVEFRQQSIGLEKLFMDVTNGKVQ